MSQFNYEDSAVMDDDMKEGEAAAAAGEAGVTPGRRRPDPKTRSLSDGGTQLSPSPQIIEAHRRTSKDDSVLRNSSTTTAAPVTPRRPDFPMRGLSLHMPQRDATTPGQTQTPAYNIKPAPLSPKLDHAQIYASPSPTNILPRHSRGLDFSRAATSLHHSTLADQTSPDASPTISGGRAMNIPGRRSGGEYGAERPGNSLWSMMGDQERANVSNSLGSNNMMRESSSSSSSDDDDFMDDEMEDTFMGTPQAVKNSSTPMAASVPWMPRNSPAVNSFRTRPRKHPRKKLRGPLGFSPATPSGLSKSPPTRIINDVKDMAGSHSRRESISWAANQLHISASDNEEKGSDTMENSAPGRDGQRSVIRRVVTRRSNLLPKTKGFARIRAALMEESAPVDAEARREAEVVRQVMDSDVNLEPHIPPRPPHLDIPKANTAGSSPNLTNDLDDIPEDEMITDATLSSSFKSQALKNAQGRGKVFWDTFSETSSTNGGRTTPPPLAFLPRGSSSGISEDINMDSPSLSAGSGNASIYGPGAALAMLGNGSGSDSQRSNTPQASVSAPSQTGGVRVPPTAEEITRRINKKRGREDDFDPMSFKRRAVSPGMSVHNSPITQSPMQRDVAQWNSRPGSVHGGDKASVGTPSENGSSANGARSLNGGKGRVGYQGMVDTNDGIMRMSIE